MTERSTRNDDERLRLKVYSFARVHRDHTGSIRSTTPGVSNDFWAPFLNVFDEVALYVRVETTPADVGWIVDVPGLEVREVPYMRGAQQSFLRLGKMIRFLFREVSGASDYHAVSIPRWPAPLIGWLVQRRKLNLVSLVAGDGAQAAKAEAPRGSKWLAGACAGRLYRGVVRRSGAVIYVTLRDLQSRFPSGYEALQLARSDVLLPAEDVLAELRALPREPTRGLSVISVGGQQTCHKGHDLLISAVGELQRAGIEVCLTLVGDGAYHSQLQDLAIREEVRAVNMIKSVGAPEDVMRLVAEHDLFIMPSLTEGLPRAMVEAMGVGTLCLGSRVGGIPELIDGDAVFEAGSVDAIVEAIRRIVDDPALAERILERQRIRFQEFKLNHTGSGPLVPFLREWVERTRPSSG